MRDKSAGIYPRKRKARTEGVQENREFELRKV
jgi:hypothetical protein